MLHLHVISSLFFYDNCKVLIVNTVWIVLNQISQTYNAANGQTPLQIGFSLTIHLTSYNIIDKGKYKIIQITACDQNSRYDIAFFFIIYSTSLMWLQVSLEKWIEIEQKEL